MVNNKKKWNTPEEYALAKKLGQSKYAKTSKGIITNKKAQDKYNKTEKNLIKAKRYYHKHKDKINEKKRNSTSRKESQHKYNISEKGKVGKKKYRDSHDPIIDNPEYNARRTCKKRDNHTCQWKGCNETESLQAHHIYKKSDYPEFKYDLWNLITFCVFHHFWTHIMNGEINDAIFVTARMDVSF